MNPQELKNLLDKIQENISEINKNWLVVNDSHIVNSLSNYEVSDNMYLVGVLPSYDTVGENGDNYRNVTFGQLLILEKTDYSELTPEQFIDVFERTFVVAKQVRNLLAEFSTEGCGIPSLVNLDVNSLKIDPVYKLAQCNGYSIEFEL